MMENVHEAHQYSFALILGLKLRKTPKKIKPIRQLMLLKPSIQI